MAFQSFENLEVWQRGCTLAVDVFETFSSCRNFTMQDQVQRAALSIPSNVAEGHERDSNKEFVRFLNISKGSCGELRTQLYISRKLHFIKKGDSGSSYNGIERNFCDASRPRSRGPEASLEQAASRSF